MKLSQIKCALITGATSDLAVRVAEHLANEGVHLILTAQNRELLLELAAILRKKVTVDTIVADLTDQNERSHIIEIIKKNAPDLLINNAGIGYYGPALMHATYEQLDILDVNARALLELNLEAARALRAHHKTGVILNIASAAAFFPYPTFAVYSASKAFVVNFSQSFDGEMEKYGIRILCACPGQIETAFRVKAAKNYPQKVAKQSLSASKAAKLLLKQIRKEKPLYVFDFRYRIILFIAKWLIPQAFVLHFLKRSIRDRYPTKDI